MQNQILILECGHDKINFYPRTRVTGQFTIKTLKNFLPLIILIAATTVLKYLK